MPHEQPDRDRERPDHERPDQGRPDDAPASPVGFTDQAALDRFLPYLFNRITNRLNQNLLRDLKPLNVGVPRWRVLAVLTAGDGRNMGELSAYTVIEQSSLSRVIDQMARDGLVKRRPNREDHRIVEVYLTAAGRALFDVIFPLALSHANAAIKGLSNAQMHTLTQLLHQVLDNIREKPYA